MSVQAFASSMSMLRKVHSSTSSPCPPLMVIFLIWSNFDRKCTPAGHKLKRMLRAISVFPVPLLHRRWQNKLGQRKCGCGHQSCSAQRFWTVPRTQDLLQLCVGISQGPQMVPNQWIAGLFLLLGFLAAGWGAKK